MNILFVDDEIDSQLQQVFDAASNIFEQIYPNSYIYKELNFDMAETLLKANNNEIGNTLDIAIIDRYCPSPGDGEEIAAFISKEFPHVALVMLTGKGSKDERYEFVQKLIPLGFCGFIDKSNFESENQIKAAFDRIFSTQSFLNKQKMKEDKESRQKNWSSFVKSLQEKGSGWFAYDKTRWLLVTKILRNKPELDQTNLSFVLHELQNLCERHVQQSMPEFTINKLKNCSDENADKWLPVVDAYCKTPLTATEINTLNRAEKERKAGSNIFSNYLNSLKNDDNTYNKALFFLFEDRNNEFKPLHKFQIIKAIKEKVEKESKVLVEKPSLTAYITEFIAHGKTLEALVELEKILKTKQELTEFLTHIIILQNRWREAQNAQHNGTQTLEQVRTERTKIDYALRYQLKAIEQEAVFDLSNLAINKEMSTIAVTNETNEILTNTKDKTLKKSEALKVFYSYSHKDKKLRERIADVLKPFEREGKIKMWFDHEIMPGAKWNETIEQKMSESDIILLLYSPTFIASNYCDKEVAIALKLNEEGKAVVIPILLDVSDFFVKDAAVLQALPKGGKPIKKWQNQNEALQSIVDGFRQRIEQMHLK